MQQVFFFLESKVLRKVLPEVYAEVCFLLIVASSKKPGFQLTPNYTI